MANPKGPLDMVDKIIKYEDGEMETPETLEFFAELHNTGTLRSLQGHYGRVFADMQRGGRIKINNDGKAEVVEED